MMARPLQHPPVLRMLTVSELEDFRKFGCQLLDIRAPADFAGGHIPESISIWRGGHLILCRLVPQLRGPDHSHR